MTASVEASLRAVAEVLRSITPFGIFGLAIVAIIAIVVVYNQRRSKLAIGLAIFAVVFVSALALFDRIFPAGSISLIQQNTPVEGPAPGRLDEVLWADTGTKADWGGRDYAYSSGLTPKYGFTSVGGAPVIVCDADRIGVIATCWDNRTDGYPIGKPADFSGISQQWCTYKESSISLATPPDGSAAPGRIYICARTVPHP